MKLGKLISRPFRFFTLLSVFAISLTAASGSEAAVWDIRKEWSVEQEDQFGDWVSKVSRKIFDPGAILNGIPLDCADFVYALRITYAAEHGLPFASKVSFKGRRLNAALSHWDHVPKERRLKEFVKDVIAGTGTWSLPQDTVPVIAISRDTVRSGTILLAAKGIGHAWMIKNVRPTGIPELIFASVPAAQELFERDGLPRGEAVFGKQSPGTTDAGFRSFCIPGKSCRWELSHETSSSQTLLSWTKHRDWRPLVLKRLEIQPEPLIESIGRELKNLCRESQARVSLVLRGRKVFESKNQCLVGLDFYNYSTNNRDSRLKEGFLDLWEIWMTTHALLEESRESRRGLPRSLALVMDQIGQVFSDGVIDESIEDLVCPLNLEPVNQQRFSLRDLRQLSVSGQLSPDPNESVLARWGLEPEKGLCARR